jgi:hypothetical protein
MFLGNCRSATNEAQMEPTSYCCGNTNRGIVLSTQSTSRTIEFYGFVRIQEFCKFCRFDRSCRTPEFRKCDVLIFQNYAKSINRSAAEESSLVQRSFSAVSSPLLAMRK